jgi:hypothetical protein
MPKSNYEVQKKHIYNWMQKNKEKYEEYSRQKGLLYYEKHKEEVLKKQKQYKRYINEAKRLRNIEI